MNALERISHFKNEYMKDKGKMEELERRRSVIKKEVLALSEKNETLMLEKEILDEASKAARENGRQVLSETCSHSVETVLEQEIKVDIEFGSVSGQPTANLIVEKTGRDGTVVTTNPAEDDGGGVGDLVALSTFFSFGLLCAEGNRAPLFLDEPTKFVSKGYSQNVSSFIKEIVEYVGKQTFMVTHDETVAQTGDAIFKVEMDENLVSHVTVV